MRVTPDAYERITTVNVGWANCRLYKHLAIRGVGRQRAYVQVRTMKVLQIYREHLTAI